MNSDNQFTNFKIHTQYSICEGAVRIDDLSKYCKENKIKAIGICDSFNLCGALEFAEKISKIGTQPIIGTQINFKFDKIIAKLPLFATTENGYNNLIKLSSNSFLNQGANDEPHCQLTDLYNHKEDLIVLSGGIIDLIGVLFKNNKTKKVEEIILKLKENFQDNFYLEIQRHNENEENLFEKFLINLSNKFNLPLIASQEVYYLDQNISEAHDALTCIREKRFMDDRNRVKLSNLHHMRKSIELIELYKDIPEALENNFNFPLRFNFKPRKSKPILPSIKTKNSSVNQELLEQAKIGLKIKLDNYVFDKKENKNEKDIKTIYEERLMHEIKIINSMQYSSYFLIVSDYIKWAKKNFIPVGPGRGSGAGSLVAYCLDITDLDPIKFDLIFERFLNPDRISMPDFDIDFCEEKRDQVFEYLKNKYKGGVAHIITFGKFKARMALRDVGRVIGLPYGYVDKICKMIPFDPSRPLTLKESIDREPRFKEEIKKNNKVEKLIELSLKIEGLNRNMATHAAGVVIAGEELTKQVPLYKDYSSNLFLPSTQFDMYSAENAGLVKFDLLGLKTLTVIDKTIKMLNEKGVKIDIKKIDLDDQNVFKLLATGETTGLFQLESTGMREAIKQMKPNKFDDIIALVALYRPGPMSNIKIYNDCKNKIREPEYIHPTLEKILKPTYGIIIYQEQVMQIAQTLAGFTAGEADILRRAMGKKKRAELERQKERFVSGAIKNNIKKDLANYIFTKIEPFAEYGFNKSHAAAYALIAFQTAYLKTYYKEDFIASTMSTELTNTGKLREFVEELKRLKVEVIRPNVNLCQADFKAEKNKIYYGLGAIKSVGFEAIANVVSERETNGKFNSISDFINRINPKDINKLQMEGLVKSGSFDELDNNRKKLLNSIPKMIQLNKINYEDKISKQTSMFKEKDELYNNEIKFDSTSTWNKKELLSEEFKSLGFYISDHPLNEYKDIFTQLKIRSYKDFIIDSNPEGIVAGTIMSIQEKKSAKGTPFAVVKFSDNEGEFELFIFSDNLILNRDKLHESESYVITLKKDKFTDDNITRRINVKKILQLKELVNKPYKNISIELNENYDLNDLKEYLKEEGETRVSLILPDKDKKIVFDLKNSRKISLSHFNYLKNRNYVKKITF